MNSNDFKNSRHRTALLNLLASTKSHPTAAWLYDNLKTSFPKLSQGTVYRNLSVLACQGLVTVLHSGSTFDRFDADTSEHYHIVCTECGKVEDVSLPYNVERNQEAEKATGYCISSHRLDFY